MLLVGDQKVIDPGDYTNDPKRNKDVRMNRHTKLTRFFSALLLNEVVKILHTPLPIHFDERTQQYCRIGYKCSNMLKLDPKGQMIAIFDKKLDHDGLHF